MDRSKAEILRDLDIAKKQVHDLTTSFSKSVNKIVQDFEDSLSFSMTRKDALKVNKESVESVVEIKKVASNISSTARAHESSSLNQEIDVKPYSKHIDASKKINSEIAKIIGRLDNIKQATTKLSEHHRIQKKSSNDNEPSVSSVSISSNDPSISEFSLFDNSNSNAATSSPIRDDGKDKKEQE